MTELTTATDQKPQEFISSTPEELKQVMIQELSYNQTEPVTNSPVRKIFSVEDKAYEDDTLIAQLTRDDFRLVSHYGGYYFTTNLRSEDEVLHIAVKLVRKVGNRQMRNPLMPHYSELFDMAINYYEGMGRNIAGVRGVWDARLPGQIGGGENTNFATFLQFLQQGFPKEEAVFSTPTGKLAKSHGFIYPVFVSQPIAAVDVIFYKNLPKA